MLHTEFAQGGSSHDGGAWVRKSAIALTRYHLRQMRRVLEDFERDALLAVLLGEIALHNLQGVEGDHGALLCSGQRRLPGGMRPCNAYSVAASTGIPRETVRRKVARLVELGWIEKRLGGHLFITEAALQHFEGRAVHKDVPELLAAADELRGLIAA
ncbi:MAG: hypothetical protein RBS40_12015 [Rhodocyclaceae bacterium]|jgi:hypothetical protein|nr:hypothetical protein [Rhodocyclaceae bacterium]